MKTYLNWTWPSNLIYHIASVFGLAPFIVRNNSLHPLDFTRKIYAMLLAVLIVSRFLLIVIERRLQQVEGSVLTEFIVKINSTFIAISLVCSLFNFAFKSRKMIDTMHRMIAIKEELANSEIEDLHDKNRNRFYAKIISTNCVSFVLQTFVASQVENHRRSTEQRAILWFGNVVAFVLHHNTILVFVETLNCIGQFFESLNNRLQGTTQPEEDFLSSCIQQSSPINEGGGRQAAQVVPTDSKDIHLAVGDVEKIGKLHRELCYLTQFTADFFTVPIVWIILQHFTKLLATCYYVYTQASTLLDAHVSAEFSVIFWLQFGARVTFTVIECLLIADACSSVCKAGNATKTILFTVWNKFNDEKLQNEFFMVSLQFLKKPVTVSAFGFFDLGYSYVLKIFYAVLAYFIIMVQLDTSRVRPKA